MITFWNVRGLNDLVKQRRLKVAFKGIRSSIVCLLETHIQQSNAPSVQSKLFPAWHCIDNYDYASLGRIWVLHDSTIRTQVFRITDQAIHVHVFSIALQRYFFLSTV